MSSPAIATAASATFEIGRLTKSALEQLSQASVGFELHFTEREGQIRIRSTDDIAANRPCIEHIVTASDIEYAQDRTADE